jgi:hypothetical protein|tara:strand:- start:1897 stop:2511 length:615 start_codon:yes stop_codon:yes gene_type:complete
MNLRSTKHSIAPLLALMLAACVSMGPQDTERYIFLDESETLFVEFKNLVDPIYDISMPDIAENMRELRRQDFMQVMQELLRLYELPIEVHLLGERERPGDGPVLEIFAPRFEQDRFGDLVATIQAKLSRYGELNTLGTYSQREIPPAMASRQRVDKAFRDMIRKPLQKMMDDLNRHFPSPAEKESVNAPLNELGKNESRVTDAK